MGVLSNLVSNGLEALANKIRNNSSKECEKKYDYINVLYFREYSHYRVYRVVYCNELENKSTKDIVDKEFHSLTDLKDFFNSRSDDVRLINVLSKDYVYLTKSGVNTDGSDFRLDKEILSDLVFHCIYVNCCLDSVDLLNNRIGVNLYIPYSKSLDYVNKSRWSLSTVMKYLDNGRMCVFLHSTTSIKFDEDLDVLTTRPKELLYDLTALSKTNQVHVNDCGDLGIQISFK